MRYYYEKKKQYISIFVTLLLIAAIAIGLYYAYTYQNKYTISHHEKLQFLMNGEVYPDVLLTPEEVESSQGIKTWIGEFPNFSVFHQDGNGFGKATYHFTFYQDTKIPYLSLYLQEPFSETTVYINSVKMLQSDHIQDYFITFLNEGNNDIIIQTTNTHHYYSGLYYPIAIGPTNTISNVILFRALFYASMLFISLALCIYNIVLWSQDKKNRNYHIYLLFGLLTASFTVYCLYPFSKLFGFSNSSLFYILEDVSMFLCIAFTIQITTKLSSLKPYWFITPITISFCLIGLIIPTWVLPHFPMFINTYGYLISFYKLIASLYMLTLCIFSIFKHKQPLSWLLVGCSIYAFSLCIHILTINYYEPIYIGWFDEFGIFGLIICFAILMIKKSDQLLKDNEQLTHHLQQEVDKQTKEIESLLIEKQHLVSEMLHDLKKPMSSAYAYLQLVKDEPNKDIENQLQIIENKYLLMNEQISKLQQLNYEIKESKDKKEIVLQDFLQYFYEMYLPDVDVENKAFILHTPKDKIVILGDENQLLRIFQNLLFNALEYTVENDTISIQLVKEGDMAKIIFKDTGKGMDLDTLPNIFERGYTTGGNGLGLYIVKRIIIHLHGTIEVDSKIGKGTTFNIYLPIL